jgi:hypothetical protein
MTRANPGRFDPHIGIMVKTPQILGPKNYRSGLRDPDLVHGGDIYKYLEYFKQSKRVLVFYYDPSVGVNSPWLHFIPIFRPTLH